MAKRFSRKVTRRTQRKIKSDEVKNIIEKDFIDSRENILKIQLDFNPHNIKTPTIEGGFNYGDTK